MGNGITRVVNEIHAIIIKSRFNKPRFFVVIMLINNIKMKNNCNLDVYFK